MQIVVAIEKRIARATFIKQENGESMYVLRYQPGERYDPHTDFCKKNTEEPPETCVNFMKRGGDRIATFIMSLQPAETGGELCFPHFAADGLPRQQGFTSAGKLDWNFCFLVSGIKHAYV